MPTPEQAEAIAGLSAFGLFVFLTICAGVALWRRWIVLGYFYQEERTGRILAETQAVRTAEALETSNEVLAAQSKGVTDLTREIAGLRREVKTLRDDLRSPVSKRLPRE